MPEPQWTRVAKLGDVKEGVPLAAKAGEADVIIVRVGDKVHVCSGECTHYGAPLSDGLLHEHIVTCPWHNARFNVETGRMVAAPALSDLNTYPVKVEDGVVFVGPVKRPQVTRPSGTDPRTFVILGGGATGNAAAEMLRREGFAGRVVIISAEAALPYDRTALSKQFIVGEMLPDALSLRRGKFYKDADIEFMGDRRATALDVGRRVVRLADGNEVAFDKLLIATGGTPRRLDVRGADLKGLLVLRSLAEGALLRASAALSKRAVILGGGFIGMEVAAALTKRELEVHVVARDALPMQKVFGEEIAKWLHATHEKNGVKFHPGNSITEIRGAGKIEEVLLTDNSRIKTDFVVAGLGINLCVDFLEGTGLVENGAVPVNGCLATKAPGIYAAGDIAVVPDNLTGEPRRIEHWVVAERQGQHAARAMMGSDAPYDEVPFFWTRQFDSSLTYIGYAARWDRIAWRGNTGSGQFMAGYYLGDTLKAAAAVESEREMIALQERLRAGDSPAFADFSNT